MNINKIKDSKYLKKEDVGPWPGKLLTIDRGAEQNIALEGKPEDIKFCLYFLELEKPLILNHTNAQIISSFLGSEETEDWNGRKIVLYSDPNISFQGKLTGGIRARAPKVNQPVAKPAPAPNQPVAKPAPAPEPEPQPDPPPDDEDPDDEDVPF